MGSGSQEVTPSDKPTARKGIYSKVSSIQELKPREMGAVPGW